MWGRGWRSVLGSFSYVSCRKGWFGFGVVGLNWKLKLGGKLGLVGEGVVGLGFVLTSGIGTAYWF
jgi:hypothetical protein